MKSLIAVAIVCLFPMSLTAALFNQATTVPTDGSVHHAGPFPGPLGQTYYIVVDGTFHIGGPGDQRGDAEYANFSDPPASLQDFDGTGTVDLGVVVNGTKLRWGPYSSNHSYLIPYVPTTETFDLSYLDSDYSDNSGIIFLTITVPEPTGMVLCLAAMLSLLGTRRRRFD